MKSGIKDNLWIAGLALAGLLFLNIFFQMIRPEHPDAETQLSEETLPQEPKKISRIEKTIFPAERPEIQSAQLELLGTIMGRTSMAFIFNPQTQSRGLYRVNDRVEGFQIAQILSGKIVLEKDGLTQEIFLTSRRSAQPAKDNQSFLAKDKAGTMIISKFQIMGQLLKANEILSKIKIMPLADATPNKLRGFRIDNVPSGSIIEDAGIKNGDVIYSVQGQRLQSMQDALAMFNRIQSQSRVEVVLLRDEQPVTLRYEIH